MGNFSTLFSEHALMSPFWLWTIFGIVVVLLLAADLFWFNRKNEEPHLDLRGLCCRSIVVRCIRSV